MGNGKRLDANEIKTALNMQKQGFSVAKIAKLLNRSRAAISGLLKDPENYGKRKSPGRPRAISERDARSILRVASNSTLTAREIAAEAGVSTNIRNVQRLLQNTDHLRRKKLQGKPPLTQQHKEHRLNFARQHLKWEKRWRKVIFTDEKRFCLDGPDGFSYYFHDLRKEEVFKKQRQMGGGGLMVWAGIRYNGKTALHFITIQDNAAIHTAKIVKEYFQNENIKLLNWPARSPDLKIMENVWGHLSRLVYSGARQFNSTEELKTAIEEVWDKIPRKYIKRLYKSLLSSMLEVVMKKGGSTHY